MLIISRDTLANVPTFMVTGLLTLLYSFYTFYGAADRREQAHQAHEEARLSMNRRTSGPPTTRDSSRASDWR